MVTTTRRNIHTFRRWCIDSHICRVGLGSSCVDCQVKQWCIPIVHHDSVLCVSAFCPEKSLSMIKYAF